MEPNQEPQQFLISIPGWETPITLVITSEGPFPPSRQLAEIWSSSGQMSRCRSIVWSGTVSS